MLPSLRRRGWLNFESTAVTLVVLLCLLPKQEQYVRLLPTRFRVAVPGNAVAHELSPTPGTRSSQQLLEADSMMHKVYSLQRLASAALIAIVALVFAACSDTQVSPPDAQGNTVTGTILDRHGNMVPEALVEAVNPGGLTVAADTSDVMGRFELSGIPSNPDGYLLKVTPVDLPPFSVGLTGYLVEAGGRTGGTIQMTGDDSCCGTLRVAVTDSTSSPIGGVMVQFRRGDRTYRTGISDSNGIVIFREVCGGEFNFRLSREGYRVVERGGLSLTGCDSNAYSMVMYRSIPEGNGSDTCCRGTLTIAVNDSASGSAINNAEVRITRIGGTARTLRTENGSVTFREVCQGTYNVRIAREGYNVLEFRIELDCNSNTSITRTMSASSGNGNDSCCNGRVEVVVRDSASGERISGATVKLWRGSTLVNTRTTSSTANAVFEGLCQGDNYSISITREGYRGLEYDFDITCDQRLEISKTLARNTSADTCCNGRLQINMRDSSSNAALSNVTVRVWRNGAVYRSGTTNANGYVVFEGICQGNYGIDFTRDGYRSREASLEMGCNQNRELTYKLLQNETTPDTCCTASMALRIRDSAAADGGYISGATIVIAYGNTTIATGTTNGDGYYLREQLCGYRTYTVTVSKSGYHTKTVSFTYTTCRRIDETIRISHE